MPNGNIYIFRGAINIAGSEAELASFVANTLARYELAIKRNRVIPWNSEDFEDDEIAIGYMEQSGYDAYALATFLTKVARDYGHGWGIPYNGSNRAHEERTKERIREIITKINGKSEHSRSNDDEYLRMIDGVLYSNKSPFGIGVLNEGEFVSPKLGFRFTLPEGFDLTWTSGAIDGKGRDQAENTMRFDTTTVLSQGSSDSYSYITEKWARDLGSDQLPPIRKLDVDGWQGEASGFRTVNRLGKNVGIGIAAVIVDEENNNHESKQLKIARLLFVGTEIAPESQLQLAAEVASSFRRVDEYERKRYIDVIEVLPGETASSLGKKMAIGVKPEELFLVINGLEYGDPIQEGSLVKLIRFGTKSKTNNKN